MQIKFKYTDADRYKRISDFSPKVGDIFVSEDNTVVILCTSENCGVYLSSSTPGQSCEELNLLKLRYRKAISATMTIE